MKLRAGDRDQGLFLWIAPRDVFDVQAAARTYPGGFYRGQLRSSATMLRCAGLSQSIQRLL